MTRRISSFAILLAMAGLVFASSPQGKREKFGSSLSRFKRDQARNAKPEKPEQRRGDAARDGRLRRVRIEVRGRPGYKVHSRQSYYAPSR